MFSTAEGDEAASIENSAATIAELEDIEPLQGMWLLRMLTTQAPVLEKAALFWHGHFATSVEKVGSPTLMWRQYLTLRQGALGPFEPLLLEMARDPAMLRWLDNNRNRRGQPNENFSREIMELFSLGRGNYTEADIQEAARAFSGWHERNGRFWFNQRAHDDGRKTVFGQVGALGGEDVVHLCATQPACSRFLARKLLAFYAAPNPPGTIVEEFAGILREHDLALGPALRHLLSSRWFFSAEVRRALIKGPIDFCIGALRSLSARCNMRTLARGLGEMGQALFAPPTVKGWDGDRAWINSHTLLVRGRFAAGLARNAGSLNASVPWTQIHEKLSAGRELTADRVIQLLHQGSLPPSVQGLLREAATEEGDGETALRELVFLVLTLPEYQLS